MATFTRGHDYVFYIGYDKDDPIFSKKEEQEYLLIFQQVYPKISFQFIEMDYPKGYLTKMWNHLARKAYADDCDYFFQCGDDIFFKTLGWVKDCIAALQQHHNVGLTGPDNHNGRILTQSFVSRKHLEIFGEYFPESIINWGCDDWYNFVYEGYLYKLPGQVCTNEGGTPRYIINHDASFDDDRTKNLVILREHVMNIAIKDREKINIFLKTK
jgi:hypothetical protein